MEWYRVGASGPRRKQQEPDSSVEPHYSKDTETGGAGEGGDQTLTLIPIFTILDEDVHNYDHNHTR